MEGGLKNAGKFRLKKFKGEARGAAILALSEKGKTPGLCRKKPSWEAFKQIEIKGEFFFQRGKTLFLKNFFFLQKSLEGGDGSYFRSHLKGPFKYR